MRSLAILLALAPAMARADDVVVFGDSWAAGAAEDLEVVLADRGLTDLTVDGRGVGGTTAEYWATQEPHALADAVSANPDARWVWLSIGGNDLFAHHASGLATTAADNDTHLRAMLDALYAEHPDIKVVMFGYDFVNFEQSAACVITAFQVFGQGATTQGINQAFLTEVGDVQATVAADYAGVTYVPSVWGTLQREGGVPNAPNVALPSPARYFADCIHPTHEGYRLILGALVDAYWGDSTSDAWEAPDPDTGAPSDTGGPPDTGPADTDSDPSHALAPGTCGCASSASPAGLWPALAALSACTRRGRVGARSSAPRPNRPR